MNQSMTDLTKNRVRVSEKKMINSRADVNQLVPFKYPWAWSMYLKSCENNWMPQETLLEDMAERVNRIKGSQTEFTILELLMMVGPRTVQVVGQNPDSRHFDAGKNNIFMYRHNTAPECRQYLLRQGMEEAIRTHLYNYVSEAIGFNDGNLTQYGVVPISKNTEELLYSTDTAEDSFTTNEPDNAIRYIQFLIENMIVRKGCLEVSTFDNLFSLQNDFPEFVKLFGYVFRDNMNHAKFAANVIQTIFEENPHLNTNGPKINESFEFANKFKITPYAKACLDELRMAIQPTYRVANFVPPAAMAHPLNTLLSASHGHTTDHQTTTAPTAVGKLDWD